MKVNNAKLDLQVCNARKGGCGGDIGQSAKLVASSEENGERVAPGFGKESEDASTAMDSESLFLLAGVLSYLASPCRLRMLLFSMSRVVT